MLSAAGVALADSWDDTSIVVVDQHGPEFLVAVGEPARGQRHGQWHGHHRLKRWTAATG